MTYDNLDLDASIIILGISYAALIILLIRWVASH
tara:strand:- start:92 stop:193 length:102 start_codon:yes stop_codon:yes gene_type:complete